MKKKYLALFILLILLVPVLVSACGSDVKEVVDSQGLDEEQEPVEEEPVEEEPVEEEPVEEEPVEEEPVEEEPVEEEPEVVQTGIKNIGEYEEMIKDTIGTQSGESFLGIHLEGNNIIIQVELGEEGVIPLKDLAISRFSSITDVLLEEGGELEDITVEFKDIGSVTLNTSEATISEYGTYFDTMIIEQNFEN